MEINAERSSEENAVGSEHSNPLETVDVLGLLIGTYFSGTDRSSWMKNLHVLFMYFFFY